MINLAYFSYYDKINLGIFKESEMTRDADELEAQIRRRMSDLASRSAATAPAKTPAAPQAEKTPFEIGQTGSLQEFREANARYKAKIVRVYDDFAIIRSGDGMKNHQGDFESQAKLFEGAIEGFLEKGRPANIQAILADPDGEFAPIARPRRRYDYGSSNDFVAGTLYRLTDGNERAADIVKFAIAKAPEEKQQQMLDYSLMFAVSNSIGTEHFVRALLEAGANARFSNGQSHKGMALVHAIEDAKPQEVIEALLQHGATFEDALLAMQTQEHEEKYIDRLRLYRDKINNDPITGDTAIMLRRTIEQQAETIDRLTQAFALVAAKLGVELPEELTAAAKPPVPAAKTAPTGP
jgi:hypothetical protein